MAITVKHTKVSTIPDGDDTSVVRPSDWNADHQLVGTVPVANGGTGAATLTGYVIGNGTGAMTASTTIPNTAITGLGTASTKDAGVANGVAIGGTTAGDGTFDILTANVSRLGNSTATYYQASNGLVSTGTYTETPPSDGLVIDYATGFGRFSDFGGDGFQWYNAGVATTKLMELSSTGALATTGTVTANGVLLTGNLGTVTSVAATAGTGISVSGSPITTSGTLTITNTAPDQTVAISSGTGISVTGTYPNFTVTNTAPSSGGTVTSVSGTTGRITSTGGTTPVIDLASGIATAGTTGSATLIPVITIDTYGRVTSITTASNPQGTVTSVGGTGTVNGLTLTGTVTSSGNLTLGGTLDLSSPPAIGGTTPAAITGTTITATKFVGVSGGTF